MRIVFLLVLSFLLSLNGYSQSSPELEKLFTEINEIEQDGNSAGGYPDNYVFQTKEKQIKKAAKLEKKLKQLKSLDLADRQDQINQAVMIHRLQNQVDNVRFKMYLLPFNAEGGFYNDPVYLLDRLPFNSTADYSAYIKWLPSFVDYLEYNQSLLEEGIAQNIMRPKVIVTNNMSLMRQWAYSTFEEHPFARPFHKMPEGISKEDQEALTKSGQEVIMNTIVPAYQKLYEFMNSVYLPASPAAEGISNIRNGREYYEVRVSHFATLDISPDSVFNLGVKEVARIRSSMAEIIGQLGFEGDFAEFIEFLRTDPQFFAKTPEELLSRAAWLSKKAEGKLPLLFSDLYDLPFTVEPVPEAIAPNYTGGRYVPGSRKQNRAGIYWVNTYDLPSRTLYTLPALTLHEAVPGHHLDMMNTASLEGVPDFRLRNYISAYGEGWGLYAEYLGEEMGMYTTPYEWFGRYTYEIWRACRLVVDVGLHYKGWSRQQAVDYLASNSALSMHEVNTEIDRYIGWPAQALSYKIGELTIKQLREEATEALGTEFDIQKFHSVVLANGSVPLPVLREEVERYIELEKQ